MTAAMSAAMSTGYKNPSFEDKTIWAKAAAFVETVTGGRCSEADFTKRLTVWCRNCDLRIVEGDKEYCGGCGCPHWRMSELSTQLRFAEFECPIGKFGKVKVE